MFPKNKVKITFEFEIGPYLILHFQKFLDCLYLFVKNGKFKDEIKNLKMKIERE